MQRYLRRYLDSLNWVVKFTGTLDYFNAPKAKYSSKTYRDQVVCIRDFLKFLGIEWAASIKLPKRIHKLPVVVKEEQLQVFLSLLNDFESFKEPPDIRKQRLQAFLILGAVSGMRAHELYNLSPARIDLENRTRWNPLYQFFLTSSQQVHLYPLLA